MKRLESGGKSSGATSDVIIAALIYLAREARVAGLTRLSGLISEAVEGADDVEAERPPETKSLQ
jgi:hypothetical protein